MERTKYQISRMYDTLYALGDELFKLHNPCDFKNGECKKYRTKKNSHGDKSCCHSCRLLSRGGCTVKNLSCKLFSCSGYMDERYPELVSILKLLRKLARENGILYTNFTPKYYAIDCSVARRYLPAPKWRG